MEQIQRLSRRTAKALFHYPLQPVMPIRWKDGEGVTWKERDAVWHDLLIFKAITMNYARDLKKGDRVQLTGELSYRVFEAKDGYNRKEATIIGTYTEKVEYEKQERMDYAAADAALKS